MANTYTSLNYHVVFSTKNREPFLRDEIRGRLWPYLGGIARENAMRAFAIGGVADHVHLLLAIPPTMSVAKAVQLIKGGSSHWVKETVAEMTSFAWQDGYGAFTVSESQIAAVKEYIQQQAEHHRRKSFAEEYREFLQRHQIELDERYLLG